MQLFELGITSGDLGSRESGEKHLAHFYRDRQKGSHYRLTLAYCHIPVLEQPTWRVVQQPQLGNFPGRRDAAKVVVYTIPCRGIREAAPL